SNWNLFQMLYGRVIRMSKERLEKIEEKHNGLIKENQLYTSMFLDTEWLIEQVKLSNDVKEDLRLSEEREDMLWEQNKRYRELIESTLIEMEGDMDYYKDNETYDWSRYDEIKGFYDYITEKYEALESEE